MLEIVDFEVFADVLIRDFAPYIILQRKELPTVVLGVLENGTTIAELTEAIRQHIDTEMDAEVASGMAEHALGFSVFMIESSITL